MDDKVTKCEVCGKVITYKTNKPKRCTECRESKGSKSRKKKGNSKPFTRWKKETLMFHMLRELFHSPCIMNGYYSWLVSPHGEPMQLDWYCPEYKIAYE